jgi:alpha-L-fucosidase 2
MKKFAFYWILSLVLIIDAAAQNNSLLKLWYENPAKQWVEALPIGNGRLGAMIFRDPCNEVIQLVEFLKL